MSIDISSLTLAQLREAASLVGGCKGKRTPSVPLPFKVGDAVIFRTVTMIDVGRVVAIGKDFVTLTEGGWVADTGRFSEMLAKGYDAIKEFEYADVPWFLVGRGAICDAFPWMHPLPKVTK